MNNCLITGSFDPMTIGHMQIVTRCQKIFDNVYIGVLNNTNKATMFNIDQRLNIVNSSIKGMDKVFALAHDGLAIDLAKSINAKTIVRGIRNTIDFEYENAMQKINNQLENEIQTIFMISDFPYISSSVIRELIKSGGSFKMFLTNEQYLEIKKIFEMR